MVEFLHPPTLQEEAESFLSELTKQYGIASYGCNEERDEVLQKAVELMAKIFANPNSPEETTEYLRKGCIKLTNIMEKSEHEGGPPADISTAAGEMIKELRLARKQE